MRLEGHIELFLRKHRRWSIPGVGTVHRVYRDAYLDHRVQMAYPGEESFNFSPEEDFEAEVMWRDYLVKTGGGGMLEHWEAYLSSLHDGWERDRALEVEGLFRLSLIGEHSFQMEKLSERGLGNWYGLPNIPFYPVNREVAIERLGPPRPKLPPGYRAEPYSFSKEILAPVVATLLVLLAYLMIFAWPGNMNPQPAAHPMNHFDIDDPKVNRSPLGAVDELEGDSFLSDEEMVDRAMPDQPGYGDEMDDARWGAENEAGVDGWGGDEDDESVPGYGGEYFHDPEAGAEGYEEGAEGYPEGGESYEGEAGGSGAGAGKPGKRDTGAEAESGGLFDEEMELRGDTPLLEQAPAHVLDNECVIIVGSFRRATNVARMEERLAGLGYEVYLEPGPRGLTRVGARLECLDEEVLDTLGFFRKSFVSDAWVLKW